jgi:hypothetical protein
MNQASHCQAAWDYYQISQANGNSKTIYYLNLNAYPEKYQNAYREALAKILASQTIELEEGIISFAQLPQELVANKESVVNQFRWANINTHAPNPMASNQQTLAYLNPHSKFNRKQQKQPRKNKQSTSVTSVTSANATAKSQAEVYPKHIDFGGGFFFNRQSWEDQQAQKSTQFAYPIRVNFLKGGKAYAAVAPNVFNESLAASYGKQIKQKLNNGSVHTDHQGGPGIQIVRHNNNVYQNYKGEIHAARIKIKVGNLGLFGHQAKKISAEGEERILYICDGVRLRH